MAGTYIPSPVRRVEKPKPSGGTRKLGIRTVQDRLIQQMMLQVLTPIFDPMFSEHSYGFRPGRSAQDAVRAAQQYAQGGKDGVVDFETSPSCSPPMKPTGNSRRSSPRAALLRMPPSRRARMMWSSASGVGG
ncbi:MAG: hypothetical protein JNN08_03845 [Bryobacterales bacterium]|nr:hypothetical protein [Bryobacterales bacterium]